MSIRTAQFPRQSAQPLESAPPIKTPWIAASLFLFTLLLYLPSLRNEFVDFDDMDYVAHNQHVLSGLSVDNFKWAFTTVQGSNWHPLTWLSLQLDAQLFADLPAATHAINALLHAANAMLLFLFLLGATRQRWPSAICAALFAWHPLRVESVAWTAERKDVLCGFFFFLTLLFYAHYVRHSKAASYWAAIGCYALGLMAKPMIVTLPCLLILVDYWPLERWRRLNKSAAALLALEKVPFLLMAAASCVVTYEAQFAGGSVMERSFTLPLRIANSCVGYARYLKAIFLPIDLCVFYPLPSPTWPIWEITCSGVLLTLLTTLALWQARRRPYLIVGWLWFCGLLVPAIGLVQVGSQSIADRYTYLPSIGITIAICWIGAEFVHRYPLGQRKCALGIGAILAVLAALTVGQIGYWHDDYSLFLHANNAVEDNWLAEGHIASELARQQDYEGAEAHFRKSIRLHPVRPGVKEALGDAEVKRGELDGAVQLYDMEMVVDPTRLHVRLKWGDALVGLGRFDQAVKQYKLYLAARPNDEDAHYRLAVAFVAEGDLASATEELERCIALNPGSAKIESSLANVFLMRGDLQHAAEHFHHALILDPNLASARNGLSKVSTLLQKQHG